ncbi:MAG: hypothetical protein NXI32_22895 [bacterium]|nr:hypothetical protein [bacterium]
MVSRAFIASRFAKKMPGRVKVRVYVRQSGDAWSEGKTLFAERHDESSIENTEFRSGNAISDGDTEVFKFIRRELDAKGITLKQEDVIEVVKSGEFFSVESISSEMQQTRLRVQCTAADDPDEVIPDPPI